MSGIVQGLPSSCEVLIVGAGPAGIALALTYRGQGQVLLVERHRSPWRKPCDGVLTPVSLRLLRLLGLKLEGAVSTESLEAIRLVDRDNDRCVSIPLSNHVMVDRKLFDSFLREQLLGRTQALFRDSCKVKGWEKEPAGIRVTLEEKGRTHQLLVKNLVDATGSLGLCRRLAAQPLPSETAVQVWFPQQGDSRLFDWIFDCSITPYYLWSISRKDGFLIGGVFPAVEARNGSDFLRGPFAREMGLSDEPFRVEAYPLAMPRQASDIRLCVGPVLAAGEAAGLINTSTGEGISFALRSGAICGSALSVAGSNREEIQSRYLEMAADLVREAEAKILHAQRLFDSRERARMDPDIFLVPVKRTELRVLV